MEPFKPLLGEGIFDTDGEHWAFSRALIRPTFTRDQVADLTTFEELIQDLFLLLPGDGKTVVDLQDLFFRYTIDSATKFLFGQSVGTLKKSESDLGFANAFHYAQEAIITRGLLGPLNIFYRDRKADECNRICREFAQEFVEEAFHSVEARKKEDDEKQTATKGRKHIFSHELAWRTSDKRRILDELMNVLLAGRDTTASLLSNLFFMLAKNPAIWDKLRREVAVLEGRPPTYDELRSLKYVQYCINECERMLPTPFRPSLTNFPSLTFTPSRTTKQSPGSTRYRPTSWGRQGRSLTGLRSKGHPSMLHGIRNASTDRYIWTRRRGVSSRALGGRETDASLGLSSI